MSRSGTSFIEESKKFVKSLKRFHQLKQKWEATKVKLFREPGMNGTDFKEWEARCFSVRVDKNFRAHLKPRNDFSGVWEALDIGDHKSMGHG